MILTAYNLTAIHSSRTLGAGQTIVIIDACGDPNIASDLHTFDQQFGLSDPTLNVLTPQGS
ncbi:MAG: hypothetical protein ACYC7D_14850 [Nitrososphaerales archaeon]